jgi:hypothetical protein
MLAIQAMELREYSHDLSKITGECHSVRATRRLTQLVGGKTVRLTARYASSTNGGRLARFVAVKGSDGVWRDVGRVLMREGLVIPSYHKVEYWKNRTYREATQRAAAAGRGLYDTNYCGVGPSESAKLTVRAHWDAVGNDNQNVNGEWFKIINHGSTAVSLAGWWVRDSATRDGNKRGYTFPSGASVAAGGSVHVHVGRGSRSGVHYYFGLSDPIFENVTGSPAYLGDGAYLFDKQGDLRAWHHYPCVYACG